MSEMPADKGSEEIMRFPSVPESQYAWYAELGFEVQRLSVMLGKRTETRPFVYELRLDLWPPGNRTGMAVLKGFGENEASISFSDGVGLLGHLRTLYGRARAGKLVFKADQYPPKNYEARLTSWEKSAEWFRETR